MQLRVANDGDDKHGKNDKNSLYIYIHLYVQIHTILRVCMQEHACKCSSTNAWYLL